MLARRSLLARKAVAGASEASPRLEQRSAPASAAPCAPRTPLLSLLLSKEASSTGSGSLHPPESPPLAPLLTLAPCLGLTMAGTGLVQGFQELLLDGFRAPVAGRPGWRPPRLRDGEMSNRGERAGLSGYSEARSQVCRQASLGHERFQRNAVGEASAHLHGFYLPRRGSTAVHSIQHPRQDLQRPWLQGPAPGRGTGHGSRRMGPSLGPPEAPPWRRATRPSRGTEARGAGWGMGLHLKGASELAAVAYPLKC